MRKLLLIVAALLLLCLPVRAEHPRLTLMIYMTGSNLESEYFAATSDIQEMVAARYNQQQINVLIMTGGSEKWWTPGVSADKLSIHRLSRVNLVLEKDYPLASMASPNPLTALLDYGYSTYPADKYALIIWDHGSGPVNGVCLDTLFAGDMLLPSELDAALAASPFGKGNKLEWIGFDACLMANAETACLLAPYARYMIASQETEPGRGWDYSFLKGAEQDATGADTGRRIIDLYYQSAMTHTPGNNITLSLLDLEKVGDLRKTSAAFFTALNLQLTANNFSALAVERQNAQGVGRAAQNELDYDLVDLYSLTSHYAAFAPTDAQALIVALEGAVLYSRSNIEGLHGLSLYHPYYNKASYQQKWRTDYRKTALSDSYLRYLDTYSGIWLGEQLTSWKGLEPTVFVDPDRLSQTIQLQLTASQAENFASAELLVFSASEECGHGFIYREALDQPDENGMLSISYDGRQLVHVDANGTAVKAGLSYSLRDDRIVLGGTLARYGKGPSVYKVMLAYFRPVGNDGTLEFLYMDEVMDNGVTNSRHNVSLDDWTFYQVLYNNRVPTQDADGEMLPFDQWEDSGWSLWTSLDLRYGLNLRFSREQVLNSDYTALLQIKDTQGNLHVTPLIELAHLKSTTLDTMSQVLLDDERCTITLRDTEVVASVLDPVMKLRVDIFNKTAEPLKLTLDYMQLNQTTPLAKPAIELSYFGIPAGETQQALISVPIAALQEAQSTQVDQLILFGDIRLTDYSDSWAFHTIFLSLEYDFSSLVQLQEEPPVLATCQTEAFTIDLLELAVDKYDALEARIRVTNRTDDDLELHLQDSRINNYMPPSEGCSVMLPAGAHAFDTITFSNSHSLNAFSYSKRSFSEDMLSDMQIYMVESLMTTWSVTAGKETSSVDVHFDLAEPFPYAEHRRDPMGDLLQTVPLYECKDFSIRLAGVATTSFSVNVGLMLENKTDRDFAINWETWGVNDIHDAFFLTSNTLSANTITLDYVSIFIGTETCPRPADSAAILLTGNVTDENGTVLFRDSYQITVTSWTEGSNLFYVNNLHAEVLEHKEDLYVPFLADSLILPENPEQYRVRLAATPIAPAVSAEATLFFKHKDYYIPVVRGIRLAQEDDGSWGSDYSGLYIGWPDHPGEIWYAKETSSNGSLTRWEMGSLVNLNLDHGILSCTDAVVTWDESGSTTIAFSTMPPATAFPEAYAASLFTSYTPVFAPERDTNGKLPAFRDLAPVNSSIWECTIKPQDLPVRFALHPAADYPGGLFILYSFTLEDGSSYSLEPVPYAQAVPQ